MKYLPAVLRRDSGEPIDDAELAAVVAHAYSRLWGDPTQHWESQLPEPEVPEEPIDKPPSPIASPQAVVLPDGVRKPDGSSGSVSPIVAILQAIGRWIASVAQAIISPFTGGGQHESASDVAPDLTVKVDGDVVPGESVRLMVLSSRGDPVEGVRVMANGLTLGVSDYTGSVPYVVESDKTALAVRTLHPSAAGWSEHSIELNVAANGSDVTTDGQDETSAEDEGVVHQDDGTPDAEPVHPTPPLGRVKSIARVYWTGRVRDVHGKPMLLDESGIANRQTLSALFFQGDVAEVLETTSELRMLLDEAPVVSPRHDSTDDPDDIASVLVSEYEVRTYRLLEKLEGPLRNTRIETASLPLLTRTSIPQAIKYDLGAYQDGDAAPVLADGDAAAVDDEIDAISNADRMTASAQLRESFLSLRDSINRELDGLAKTREESLINILGGGLDDLIRYYDFPMYDFYCPRCFKRSMDGAGVSLDPSEMKLDQASAENIAAAEFALKSSILDIRDDYWVCPLCNWSGLFDAPSRGGENLDADGTPRYLHRVWANLVAPLWDTLWAEKSTHDERARIIREKEAERRRNLAEEFNELNDLKNEFSSERRRMQDNMENLRVSSMRSQEALTSLLRSFKALDVIPGVEVDTHHREEQARSAKHVDGFEKMREALDEHDAGLEQVVESSRDRRSPIIDPDFQVRSPVTFKLLETGGRDKEPQTLAATEVYATTQLEEPDDQ